MDGRKPSPSAGETLKELRVRLGLTTRDVEAKSQQIADERHSREYYLSHAWVTDIENGKFTPSIYKFHTFSTSTIAESQSCSRISGCRLAT